LGLPSVPIVEKDVVLTQELVDKYTKLDDLNGQLFEGVVVNTAKTSFKILSLNYDQRK
jgi:hypothetical protein